MSEILQNDDFIKTIIDNDNLDDLASTIVEDMVKNKSDILTLVEKLSPSLTNTDVEIRVKGMNLYSSVLTSLPKDYLTKKQLEFITEFYIDRLKDNHKVIPPVLLGVLALVRMTNLPESAPGKLLMNIFQQVPCQQQLRVDRHHIYTIIHHSVLHFSDELKPLGPDFVYGVISSIDGERDPRNLILLFSILPTFLRLMPLGHLTEEMFEVIACYFPVDFTSPKDDPNAITREDLADKLCPCLCGNQGFAEFCLPLLLEKLDSNLKVAKIDSLKLLSASCEIFPASGYEENMLEILSSIQKEISHKTDTELSNLANETLSVLVAKFYRSSVQSKAEIFISEIIRSAQCLLVEANTKPMFDLPLKILLSTAKACKESIIYVSSQMVPILTTHFYLKNEEFIKISLLQFFSELYKLSLKHDVSEEMRQVFENLPKMFLAGINEQSLDLKIAGYSGISNIGTMMSPESYAMLCDNIDSCIYRGGSENLKNVCKNCLLSLVRQTPQNFSSYVERKLHLDLSGVDLNNYIDLLCLIASEKFYTNIIFSKFTDCLNSTNITIGAALISVCLKNFKNASIYSEELVRSIQNEHNFIQHLLTWTDNTINESNTKNISEISSLIKVIMKHLAIDEQISILDQQISKYYEKVFDQHNEIYIFIVEALFNSLRLETFGMKSEITDLVIQNGLKFCLSSSNIACHERSCHLIANILNKVSKKEHFQKQYSYVNDIIHKHLADDNNNDESKSNSIILHCWITKSLLLAGNPHSTPCLLKVFDLLKDEKFAMEAAKGLKLIMEDSNEVLSRDCFCLVNLIYKQKVFQIFLTKVNNLTADEKGKFQKPAYHLAWAYILQFAPKSVLQTEIDKVFDVLIESLDFEDPELLVTSLETLSYLMQKKNKTLLKSLQSLLPRCVKLGKFTSSMKVRMSSMKCLFDIANNVPTVNILPFKQDLIFELTPYLDDPKRLVRNAAVKARTRWYLVGSPGEEKINE